MALTGEEYELIDGCIENEGFDYCFVHYSEFSEIKDKKFHKLRLKYLDARGDLAEYIGIED